LAWRFGKRLISSPEHEQTEPAADRAMDHKKQPPSIMHSPAAE
jgi:hypothetical protein